MGLAALGLPLAGLLGWYALSAMSAQSDLEAAIAETDRLDPDWRLEEIEAKRKILPDEANGALQVLKAYAALPKGWTSSKLSSAAAPARDPNAPLTTKQLRTLRAELGAVSVALAEARRIADLPEGRFPITYSRIPTATLLPHIQMVADLACLLEADVLLRAHDGDADAAVGSLRALLNCGRAVGDEPLLISQLVRLNSRQRALRSAERVLAQRQLSEAALGELQVLLRREADEPVLYYALRGERAFTDRTLEVTPTASNVTLPMRLRNIIRDPRNAGTQLQFLWPAALTLLRADVLRGNTRAVEIAKLPSDRWQAEYDALLAESDAKPSRFVPGFTKSSCLVWQRIAEADADLRSTLALVACERYRLGHGRWPESLQSLVPEFLDKVPTDPFDGRPLRYRRLPDGVVIYSIGPDHKDGGGAIRKDGKTPGDDIGRRLWDPDKRPKGRPVEEL